MGNDFTTALRPALVLTILFALLLGIGYPLAMTVLGQALFPFAANGSLVEEHGKVIGSTVVGQAFTTDRYFRTRPSAAGKGYDGLASSGSNYGPTAQPLVDRVKPDVARYRGEGVIGPLPADLVTASGSGLDPDLSPEAAAVQVGRVARIRHLDPSRVSALVAASTEQPLLGIIGEPHVNVLALNRALDGLGHTP
jgi:K+-transporting ATPase ATPase C chain